MKHQVDHLYEEYIKVRKVDLDTEQFIYLMNLYPSLLVCMSDGVLDKEEWDGVLGVANGLADNYASSSDPNEKERIAQLFRTEFRYLLENIDRWKKKFLNALKSHLDDHRDEKDFVMESMYLFANAADGISDVEQATIEELSQRLSLEH
ncbi:MAG: hypothetical protein AAGA85_22635 [Bacteroidota bacterium]